MHACMNVAMIRSVRKIGELDGSKDGNRGWTCIEEREREREKLQADVSSEIRKAPFK